MAAKKRLTQAEQNILRHPPTKQTWECRAHVLRSVGGQIQTDTCRTLNVGMASKCWVCGKRKPAKVRLVWPTYIAVCSKAGIEPGTRWPVRETPIETAAPKKAARRKGNS